MSLKCGVGYGYRLICFTLWGVGMWCVLTWAVSVGVIILVPFGYYFTADLEYGFLRDKREFFSVAVTSLRSMHTSWVHQSLSSVAFISGFHQWLSSVARFRLTEPCVSSALACIGGWSGFIVFRFCLLLRPVAW